MTFVFLFLPIVCALYALARKEIRNYILLIASILFYAWGEPRYVAVMLLTILINYLGGLFVAQSKHKRTILWLTILGNLSFLVYFKYFNFLAENLNALIGGHIDFIKVVMPIGISFYTFQALSYVIDVYRGETKVQRNVFKLALFITLFPQLVAGPIVKYHDVADQIDNRTTDFDKVAYGVKRFIVGLAKKILIANTLGAVADKVFTQPVAQLDCITTWLGAVCYTLQIYYDFSGYSDMAIGLGSIFGFRFLENFNYPYISKSITEFWRRWHISLSTWFKEYLYIPLGGNRVSKGRNYLNLFVVFLATGIWHGAAWNFVVWGLWHGFFIILEKMTGLHRECKNIFFNIARHCYLLLVVMVGWVMFRADTLTYAWHYLLTMSGMETATEPPYKLLYYADRLEVITLVVGIIGAAPVFSRMIETQDRSHIRIALVNTWLLVLFVLSASFMEASTYNPFIYFRF